MWCKWQSTGNNTFKLTVKDGSVYRFWKTRYGYEMKDSENYTQMVCKDLDALAQLFNSWYKMEKFFTPLYAEFFS